MKAKITVIAVVLAQFCLRAPAETTLGHNYLQAEVAAVRFGDDTANDILGTGYGIAGAINFNVKENLDLVLYAGGAYADGNIEDVEIDVTTRYLGASFVFFQNPDGQLNPYIGLGISAKQNEMEASRYWQSVDEDEENVGFDGSMGVEYELSPALTLNAGFDYDSDAAGDASTSAYGTLGYWMQPLLQVFLDGAYDFDSEGSAIGAGMLFKY